MSDSADILKKLYKVLISIRVPPRGIISSMDSNIT